MKNKYINVVISLLFVLSFCDIKPSMKEVVELQGSGGNIPAREALLDFVFQEGMWQRLTKKMNTLWINFKRRNIPKPKLIDHKNIFLDNKKCEIFRYNTAYDNKQVKKLRENLKINGTYLSMDSNKNFCNKTLEEENSTVDECLFRLLQSIASIENTANKISEQPLLENAYIQLIWEVESVLPKELDDDDNIKNARFFLNLCVKFLSALDKKVVERSILAYLSIWKRYTARFQNSKALDMAISSLEPVNLFSFE